MNEIFRRNPEEREGERQENPITVYYLRHGESSSDKTDPLRGLTEKGIAQVQTAIERITKEIKNPSTQIRLYSSGSERTREQCIVAAQVLHRAGFNNITIDENSLPEKKVELQEGNVRFGSILEKDERAHAYEELIAELSLHREGPGVARRIGELKAPKDYMAKLRSMESETGIGAVVHWLRDPQVPEGAESSEQKAEIIENAIEIASRWAQHMKKQDSKPVMALVFGHSSALTAYGAKVFGWGNEELEEIENAEGLKINFSGVPSDAPKIEPYGEKIESKVDNN